MQLSVSSLSSLSLFSFGVKGKEQPPPPQKKKGFHVPTEPLRSLEKKPKTYNKARKSSQKETQAKRGKEGQCHLQPKTLLCRVLGSTALVFRDHRPPDPKEKVRDGSQQVTDLDLVIKTLPKLGCDDSLERFLVDVSAPKKKY